MEPDKTHSATLPQQELTRPAEGCPSEPRSEDLMLGGSMGANPCSGQRVAQTETISRLEVYDFFVLKSKEMGPKLRPTDIKPPDRLILFKNAFETRLGPLSEDYLTKINLQITKLLSKCEEHNKKCKYTRERFISKNSEWLNKTFTEYPSVATRTKKGNSPRSAQFNTQSDRQKRRSKRKLETILEAEPSEKLIKCFSGRVTENVIDAKALELVINQCVQVPSTSVEIESKITTEQIPCTAQEALALIIDRKFTKETYLTLREFLNRKNFPAFPPYSKVQDAKLDCHPPQLLVSEVEAHAPFQSLLNHTFSRLVQLYEEVIAEYCRRQNTTQLNCIFSGAWGFDGSTGQALYKQNIRRSENEPDSENSLVATTFVPLKIETVNKDVIWLNPAPQSYRSCRPLHIQYRKESTELILSEQKWVEDQIKELNTNRLNTILHKDTK
jgi:hypothetical protein